MINIWRLVTHHVDPEYALNWAKREGKLAIGWGHIGDIKEHGYNSPETILQAISIASQIALSLARAAHVCTIFVTP